MADISTLTAPERADDHRAPPAPPARPLRRARPLPNGRAVVGGLLVAVAAVGLFWSYTRVAHGPTRGYVVVRNAVRVGARVKAGDVEWQRIDLPVAVQRGAFGAVRDVVGATAVAPLLPGQLLQRGDVQQVGSGRAHEVTFTVDRGHTSSAVAAGERVDVIATYGAGDQTTSQVVMRGVLVVAFGGNRGTFTDGAYQVTVAVATELDAVKLTAATQGAKVSLVRASGALDGA